MILVYLDPGTGSLMIQFSIAAVTGVLLFYRQIKIRIKNFLIRLFGKTGKSKDEPD